MTQKTKRVLMRFLKGFASGAIASMLAVVIISPASWGEVWLWLNGLAISGFIGGVSGLLLALQKWASWEDEEIKEE